MAGLAVISCGQPSPVLELVERPLDNISVLIDFLVVFPLLLAIGPWWNNRYSLHGGDGVKYFLTVIPLVRQHMRGTETCDQFKAFCTIVTLPTGQDQTQRASQNIDTHVDFGAQSASGTPQSLIPGPPFPVAAC